MSGLPIGSAVGGVLAAWSLGASFAVAALVALVSAAACYALIPGQD
jgi:hypothetical protein